MTTYIFVGLHRVPISSYWKIVKVLRDKSVRCESDSKRKGSAPSSKNQANIKKYMIEISHLYNCLHLVIIAIPLTSAQTIS